MTLGGNGKRNGHVRLPLKTGADAWCTYRLGVRVLFSFDLLRDLVGGLSTHSGSMMNCSMSYDWMKDTAWAQKVLVHLKLSAAVSLFRAFEAANDRSE